MLGRYNKCNSGGGSWLTRNQWSSNPVIISKQKGAPIFFLSSWYDKQYLTMSQQFSQLVLRSNNTNCGVKSPSTPARQYLARWKLASVIIGSLRIPGVLTGVLRGGRGWGGGGKGYDVHKKEKRGVKLYSRPCIWIKSVIWRLPRYDVGKLSMGFQSEVLCRTMNRDKTGHKCLSTPACRRLGHFDLHLEPQPRPTRETSH